MTKYADTNENWIENLNTRTLNLDNSTEKNTFTLRVRGGDSENYEKKSTDPVGPPSWRIDSTQSRQALVFPGRHRPRVASPADPWSTRP